MRFCSLFLWVFVFLTCAGPVCAEEDLSIIGMGGLISTTPYRGVGSKSSVVPIVVWEYKDFYIRGVEVGHRVYDNDKVKLSVMAAPRFMGYHSSDSDALSGMQDRELSVDAGFKAEFILPYSQDLFLTAKVVTDAASKHNGQEAELSFSKKFRSRIFRLTPSVGARFQSAQMVDYYYGVESLEARADRPAYEPGHVVNFFTDVMFAVGLSPQWIVITKAGVEFLGSGIRKSPIVKEDYTLSGIIGLARKF